MVNRTPDEAIAAWHAAVERARPGLDEALAAARHLADGAGEE